MLNLGGIDADVKVSVDIPNETLIKIFALAVAIIVVSLIANKLK